MFHALVDRLGGHESITEAQMIAVGRAADLIVASENTRARALRGEPVDLLALVRLENLAARAVRALGRRNPSVPDNPLTYARRHREGRDA